MRDYKVYYGIPTYTQAWRARDNIQHIIRNSTLVPDQFVVIDNSEIGSATPVLQPVLDAYRNVQVIPRTKNILSGAWNDLMNLWPDDYIIIANDDVTPHPHTIEALVTAAREHPEYAMVNGSGDSGNSYSFFLLKKWAYELIGPFDEEFIPAYFEDNDYDRRKDLLQLIRYTVPGATFDHIGSATIKSFDPERMARQHLAFATNENRYRRKWGGRPTEETFDTPFARGIEADDD